MFAAALNALYASGNAFVAMGKHLTQYSSFSFSHQLAFIRPLLYSEAGAASDTFGIHF